MQTATKQERQYDPELVDEAGMLTEAVKAAKLRLDEIKEQLDATGLDEFSGHLFYAGISRFDRESLDLDAVREKLSPQFIAAHTRSTRVVALHVKQKPMPNALRILGGLS